MAEEKRQFRAMFDGTCSKCMGPIKGFVSNGWTKPEEKAKASEVSWSRIPDGKKFIYHIECKHLPTHPDFKPRDGKSPMTIPTEGDEEPTVTTSPTGIPPATAVSANPSNVPPAPTGGLEGMLAAALMPHIEGMIANNRVELSAEITAQIEAAVQGATKVLTVENRRTGNVVPVGRQHDLFPLLLELIAGGENVYMTGPPGSGKSTAAMKAAEALELGYGYISLSAQTAESRILGFMNASGVYVETEFYRCYKNGGVFCIDEMDNASANLLTALNSALENGRAAFPHEVVEKHQDFVMVATGNTAGYGANPMFPERRPMDAAFRERFVFLEWGYDESLERDLALSFNDKAAVWVDWVQKVRKFSATNFPKLLVTPRASIKGSRLLKGGVFKPNDIADMVIFKGFDKDSKARVIAANPLPRYSMA